MPRFVDTFLSQEHRFGLAWDHEAGEPCLTFPVSNRLVDYEEYYRLSETQYRRFLDDPEAARTFAEACKAHRHDDLLIFAPGSDRGVPS